MRPGPGGWVPCPTEIPERLWYRVICWEGFGGMWFSHPPDTGAPGTEFGLCRHFLMNGFSAVQCCSAIRSWYSRRKITGDMTRFIEITLPRAESVTAERRRQYREKRQETLKARKSRATAQSVLAFLGACLSPCGRSEVAAELGVSTVSAGKQLERLYAQNRIAKLGRGRYAAIPGVDSLPKCRNAVSALKSPYVQSSALIPDIPEGSSDSAGFLPPITIGYAPGADECDAAIAVLDHHADACRSSAEFALLYIGGQNKKRANRLYKQTESLRDLAMEIVQEGPDWYATNLAEIRQQAIALDVDLAFEVNRDLMIEDAIPDAAAEIGSTARCSLAIEVARMITDRKYEIFDLAHQFPGIGL